MSEPIKPLIEMSEGVKILYKGELDNLIFLKRQQWMITNYSLVAYAAVVTIARGASIHEKWALSLIAVAAWLYGSWCLIHTQRAMTTIRGSLFHIFETHFHQAEREAFSAWKERPTFNYTPEFIYGLLVANFMAFGLSVYLVWRGLPDLTSVPKPV